jgi:hypothetical protein
VAVYIDELINTSTDETRLSAQGVLALIKDEYRLSAQGVLALVKDEYPHADIKTVSNALTNLHRRNAITKYPSCKGIRGALWGPILKEIKPKPERQFNAKQVGEAEIKPKPERQFNAKQVGEAVITALINMKKRIKEQDERVDRLLNTLSNREASWKTKEADFRSRIVDQNKIIASLQAA